MRADDALLPLLLHQVVPQGVKSLLDTILHRHHNGRQGRLMETAIHVMRAIISESRAIFTFFDFEEPMAL